MPFKSEAQRRLFYAAASGHARGGPSPEVAKKFIADSGHQSGSLPEHVTTSMKKLAKKRAAKK